MNAEDLMQKECVKEMAYTDAHIMQFNSKEEMFTYMDSIEEYEDINDFENPEEILQAIEDGIKHFHGRMTVTKDYPNMLGYKTDKFQSVIKAVPVDVKKNAEKAVEYFFKKELMRCKKLHNAGREGTMYSCYVTSKYRIILQQYWWGAILLDMPQLKNVYTESVNDQDRG